MRRKIGRIMAVLLAIVLLTACAGKDLPEGFVEEEVLDRARNVASLMTAEDYEGTAALFSPAMAEKLDAATMEETVGDQIRELGEFEAITTEKVAGASDKDAGDVAVVVLVCKHTNGKATYTISIDRDDRICGLYMRCDRKSKK